MPFSLQGFFIFIFYVLRHEKVNSCIEFNLHPASDSLYILLGLGPDTKNIRNLVLSQLCQGCENI